MAPPPYETPPASGECIILTKIPNEVRKYNPIIDTGRSRAERFLRALRADFLLFKTTLGIPRKLSVLAFCLEENSANYSIRSSKKSFATSSSSLTPSFLVWVDRFNLRRNGLLFPNTSRKRLAMICRHREPRLCHIGRQHLQSEAP